MRRAGAKAPASRRPLRLDVQVDDASRTGSLHFEPVVGTIDADLAEPERVDEERFLVAHVAHRQHGPKETACPDVSGDLRRRPRISLVLALLNHFEEQPCGMPYPQILRANPFLHATVFGPVPIEVLFPERDRSVRNRIADAGQLARAGSPRLARVRKTRGDGTHVGIGISVVEVIDGDASIHQDGLLDQPLPEYLGKEVDILLCAAGAQRDVVNALHETFHGLLLIYVGLRPTPRIYVGLRPTPRLGRSRGPLRPAPLPRRRAVRASNLLRRRRDTRLQLGAHQSST